MRPLASATLKPLSATQAPLERHRYLYAPCPVVVRKNAPRSLWGDYSSVEADSVWCLEISYNFRFAGLLWRHGLPEAPLGSSGGPGKQNRDSTNQSGNLQTLGVFTVLRLSVQPAFAHHSCLVQNQRRPRGKVLCAPR